MVARTSTIGAATETQAISSRAVYAGTYCQRYEFQLSGHPLFDDTGKFTGYRGTGRITRIETKALTAAHGPQASG